MKSVKRKSRVFAILAGILLLSSAAVSFLCQQQLPMLLTPPKVVRVNGYRS